MSIFRGHVAEWLATCAQKPKVPGSTLAATGSTPATMSGGELSVVITQLMPKCL